MIITMASFCLILALWASLGQAASGFLGARANDGRLIGSSRALADVSFLATLLAFLGLLHGFIASDFSVRVVAEHSLTLKPLIYKIAATWGHHEGSMLLWCLISCGFGAILAHRHKGLSNRLYANAMAVQGLLCAAMLAYLIFASNPFDRLLEPPLQGNDLNPLLQDPALAAHPPLLYLGYVGASVGFSLAMAALIDGKVDASFARILRPWVLFSWAVLGVGIALGSFWAYYELGWGGWWFWDPVENASLMPWLFGAALLHSVVVMEKRGALAHWTILLAILTFSFALLGTFLVRSGVLTSVHAFALDPKRGIFVLAILAVVTGSGLMLYGLRAPLLGSDKGQFKPVSREGGLILNNLFLATATAVVLLGTLYPLIGEALFKRSVSVGPPYYHAVILPLMGACFIFLPIVSRLKWKRSDVAPAIKGLWLVALAALVAGLIILLTMRAPILAVVGEVIGFWVLFGALFDLWERLKAGRTGAGIGAIFARLGTIGPQQWAMSLAHFGLGLFILAAISSSVFKIEKTIVLAVGESTNLGAYTITYKAPMGVEGPNFYGDGANVLIQHGAESKQVLAQRRYYPAAGSPTTEVGIWHRLGADIYVAMGEARQTDAGKPGQLFRLYVNPMIGYVFLGFILMSVGGLIGLLARRVRFAPMGSRGGARAGQGAGAVKILALVTLGLLFVGAPQSGHAQTGDSQPSKIAPVEHELSDPKLEARAQHLATEIRCIVCQNEPISESSAELAVDMRMAVRARLAAGDSDGQVRAFFASRYGPFVLLRPSFDWANLALWLGPLLIFIFGAYWLWRMGGQSNLAKNENESNELDQESQDALAAIEALAKGPTNPKT